MTQSPLDRGWSLGTLVAASSILIASVAIHVMLFSSPGYVGDLDQFVLWVHDIATMPLGRAYDLNLTFPPVMVYVWSILAALEPALRTATTSADPAIRAVMKLPASLADLGLAAGVGYYLRDRPRWAVAAVAAVALNPVVLYVSAWWGQYESIYVLSGLGALLFATRGHRDAGSIAVALAVMTKPQALPFLVPFAAWVLGTAGWRGAVRSIAVVSLTILALWLPFVAEGGPLSYLRSLGDYQGGIFAVLSLRAWNPWWLVQQAGGGQYFSDATQILGPITPRVLGYGLAALGEAAVFVAVMRQPTPRRLALGLAASVLVAFVALTSMHERYAYGAIVFLAVLLPEPRIRLLWLVLTAVTFANLVAASLPDVAPYVSAPWVSIAGSILVTAIAVATLVELRGPGPSQNDSGAERQDARLLVPPDLRAL